jgi:transposase InsO family protein
VSRYRFVDAHRAEFPLRLLLSTAEIPESSYHYWDRAGRAATAAREAEADRLSGLITAVFEWSGRTYGADRVRAELARRGTRVSGRRVAELMAAAGLAGLSGREQTTTTTRRDRLAAVHPDLVDRQFLAAAPNLLWYGDITYIWVEDKFFYLATVIDAATKEVLGWALADNMRAGLVVDALNRAVHRRGGAAGVIFHSDRGSQYTSAEFAAVCARHEIRQSMGRTGVCWDNAAAESFFSTLKRELVRRFRWRSAKDLKQGLFQWIETWYNRRRLHSSIGYRPPVEAYQAHLDRAA